MQHLEITSGRFPLSSSWARIEIRTESQLEFCVFQFFVLVHPFVFLLLAFFKVSLEIALFRPELLATPMSGWRGASVVLVWLLIHLRSFSLMLSVFAFALYIFVVNERLGCCTIAIYSETQLTAATMAVMAVAMLSS